MPELAPAEAKGEWTAYRKLFVVREAGLVGVREYPTGSSGGGDVDSGPLVLGVSLSASAVTLAAARANGDVALAETLDREAESFGIGLQWAGERRYALGQLPIGDAWLAWARRGPCGAGRRDRQPTCVVVGLRAARTDADNPRRPVGGARSATRPCVRPGGG